MNQSDIEKLFPTLDKSTLTAAQYEYAREIIDISRNGLETMIYGGAHTFQRTWQADEDVTVTQKLQSLGSSAQPLLALHGGTMHLLNTLAAGLNSQLPPDAQIELYEISVPGAIKWNPDGSVAAFTPKPEPEPEP